MFSLLLFHSKNNTRIDYYTMMNNEYYHLGTHRLLRIWPLHIGVGSNLQLILEKAKKLHKSQGESCILFYYDVEKPKGKQQKRITVDSPLQNANV